MFFVAALVIAAAPASVDSSRSTAPNPAACNPIFHDSVVLCTSRQTPHAGHLFTGGYAWIYAPNRVEQLTCDVKLGGRIVRPSNADPYLVGGVRLTPVLRRFWSRPTADGTRYIRRATCNWWIPRGARGLLLSTLLPPDLYGDEDAIWGLYVILSDGSHFGCQGTTWRIGFKGLVTRGC